MSDTCPACASANQIASDLFDGAAISTEEALKRLHEEAMRLAAGSVRTEAQLKKLQADKKKLQAETKRLQWVVDQLQVELANLREREDPAFSVYRERVTTALSIEPSSCAEDVAEAISALAEAADDARALPIFQRLVERTAAALGLDKEYFDEELQEMCLPSWHDIPERVAALVKAVEEKEGKAAEEKPTQKPTPLKRKAPVRKK